MMNPEGSVGECPEALGEILAVIPALQKEYAGLLAAYIVEEGCFLENEQLQKG